MTTFIYGLQDPRTQEIRYIGKADNPKVRLSQHLLTSKKKKTYRDNWIQNVLNDDLKPILIILEECGDDWSEREQYHISQYDNLTNLTKGGEGTIGFKPSDETKALWSQQRKGKKQTPAQYEANCNRIITDETREKQRIANAGHSRHTPEQIAIIIKGNKERGVSDETRALMSQQRKGKPQTFAQYIANCCKFNKLDKKIICLTNGKTYDNICVAAFELKVKPKLIRETINGKVNIDYQFKYLD